MNRTIALLLSSKVRLVEKLLITAKDMIVVHALKCMQSQLGISPADSKASLVFQWKQFLQNGYEKVMVPRHCSLWTLGTKLQHTQICMLYVWTRRPVPTLPADPIVVAWEEQLKGCIREKQNKHHTCQNLTDLCNMNELDEHFSPKLWCWSAENH